MIIIIIIIPIPKHPVLLFSPLTCANGAPYNFSSLSRVEFRVGAELIQTHAAHEGLQRRPNIRYMDTCARLKEKNTTKQNEKKDFKVNYQINRSNP